MEILPKKAIAIKIKARAPASTPAPASVSDGLIEKKYRKLKLLEQILLRPGTYVGSTQLAEQEMFVFDEETQLIVKQKIKFVPSLYKLYDEGVVNMIDHVSRMRDIIDEQAQIIAGKKPHNPKIEMTRKYHPVKTIEITVDTVNQQVILKNDGDGLDVVEHADEKMYIPELIFGNLLTGTNFDENEDRTIGGQNGYGAKLINIFSTEFIIETVDSHRGLRYVQRFFNNMKEHDPPCITKYKGAPYTQISFKPDFPKFGLTNFSDDQTVLLMRKRAYDVAACTPKRSPFGTMGQKSISKHSSVTLTSTSAIVGNVSGFIRWLIRIGKLRCVSARIIPSNRSLLSMGSVPIVGANMWNTPPM